MALQGLQLGLGRRGKIAPRIWTVTGKLINFCPFVMEPGVPPPYFSFRFSFPPPHSKYTREKNILTANIGLHRKIPTRPRARHRVVARARARRTVGRARAEFDLDTGGSSGSRGRSRAAAVAATGAGTAVSSSGRPSRSCGGRYWVGPAVPER